MAQTGRKLGPRALKTRDRLLDATASLLQERSVLDLTVTDIARSASTSPATFYYYFEDVEDAVLLLAEQAAEELPHVIELLDAPWRGQQGLQRAREIVSAFIDHWDRHHAVLLVRNHAADKGDTSFQRVRRLALAPVLDQFARRIEESQAGGRVSSGIHAYIAAAGLVSVLERLSAHYRDLQHFEATREQLVETCARILFQTVTGRSAP